MRITEIFALGGDCDYGKYHHYDKGHYKKGYYGSYGDKYYYKYYKSYHHHNHYYRRGLLGIL